MMPVNKAILLLSGGLDSATILSILANKKYQILALSFHYGQKHFWELEQAKRLVKYYQCQHKIISIDASFFQSSALVNKKIIVPKAKTESKNIPPTYVPARNILFLSYALALAESASYSEIYLGINALDYSGYPDCRSEFLDAFQEMARLGMRCGIEEKPIQIKAPLIDLSKKQIIKKAKEHKLPFSFTSSCYQPKEDGRPCGVCDSCLLRSKGFAEAKLKDPLENIQS